MLGHPSLQGSKYVQRRFLAEVGVNETTALLEFSLAPLAMRRDIAMLGVLHRAALGQCPPHLREMCQRRPGSLRLVDAYEGTAQHALIKRSAWNLGSSVQLAGKWCSQHCCRERLPAVPPGANKDSYSPGIRGRHLGKQLHYEVNKLPAHGPHWIFHPAHPGRAGAQAQIGFAKTGACANGGLAF